jgi:NADPH:quinone reductase-like Zn-dependent oxidoreductase
VKEVWFLGNGEVRVLEKALPSPTDLSPGELLIEVCCSLVSPGTELKAFSGDLTAQLGDQPLDLTLSSLQEGVPRYPMRYGYSVAGRVVAEGRCEGWLGKRVFAFAPHGSHARARVGSGEVLEVPEDVSLEDAAFLPAVETAVSLVMAGRPLLGDRVLVVGQGLIGLLVAAVLQQSSFLSPSSRRSDIVVAVGTA